MTTIDYITITTTGNATDFGDLADRWNTGCLSDGLRGVWAGGYDDTSNVSNIIDYIVIQTLSNANTGNATDFGDLSDARKWLGSCSGGT